MNHDHDNVIAFPLASRVHSRKPRRSNNGTSEERAAIAAVEIARQVPAPVIQLSKAPFAARVMAQIEARPDNPKRRLTDDEWYYAFGNRLRMAREVRNISIEDAAAAGGRSVETWRNYESTGKGNITYPLLCFAKRFGISLDDFFVHLED